MRNGSILNPRERVERFLAGMPADRVVCAPLILNHAARVLDAKVSRYATDGETMGRAHVAAYRRYGQDLITIFTDTSFIAEAMGTELSFPEDDVSRLKKPAVLEAGDVERLREVDARASARLPVFLEAIRRCVAEVGDEVFVSCCIPAPFSTAAALRGTAVFARDLIRNRSLSHELLRRAEEVTGEFCAAVVEAGGIPVLVDPVASCSVISRAAFEEYAMPGIAALVSRIRALGMPGILHICGRAAPIVDLMADTGAGVLSVDDTPLAAARELVGSRVCIMGNVCPAGTLLEGPPERIRAEARTCLDDCGDSPGGFILATGCEVPLDTPPEHIDALMSVAMESASP